MIPPLSQRLTTTTVTWTTQGARILQVQSGGETKVASVTILATPTVPRELYLPNLVMQVKPGTLSA